MAKGKGRDKVKLVSTGVTPEGKPTRYTYTTTINKTKLQGKKLEFMKHDPMARNPDTGRRGAHVLFKQEKI